MAEGSAPGLEKPRQTLGAAAMEDCVLGGAWGASPNLLESVRPLRQVGHGARRHPFGLFDLWGKGRDRKTY